MYSFTTNVPFINNGSGALSDVILSNHACSYRTLLLFLGKGPVLRKRVNAICAIKFITNTRVVVIKQKKHQVTK